MRIGLDYRPALVNREGIGRATRELVRRLPDALEDDDDVRLFGSTLRAARFDRAELGLADPRVGLHRLRLPSRALTQLLRTTRRGVDDLVGGCDLYHHTQPHRLPVRRALEVVTVYDAIFLRDAEGPDPPGWVEPETARRMARVVRDLVAHADLVLVPCAHVADEAARLLGADAARTRVTTLGCDHLPLVERDPDAPPFVLTVTRVDPRKNLVGALAAFERVAAAGHPHRWVVAGPAGWASEDFAAALAASPARERVEWRQFVDEDSLARLYADASLFLWPSRAEGFGLPPLEAMRAGAPVVAGDQTSLPEVLGDGARLVDPDDVDAIAAAALDLLEDRDARAALVERGRAQAARRTWRACAEETYAAYRELVGSS